jgi:hypothetical protein
VDVRLVGFAGPRAGCVVSCGAYLVVDVHDDVVACAGHGVEVMARLLLEGRSWSGVL